MRRMGCAFLTVLIILSALQPLIYARAGTKSNSEEDFDAYSARYIVKYASDSRQDEAALLKGAKPAFKKAKEQKDAAVAAALAEENEQVKNERLERKMRIRVEGMDSPVETTALDISTESQYDVIQLEEAVPPSAFMEALKQKSGDRIEYIQPDYVMTLATNENTAQEDEAVELQPLTETQTNAPDQSPSEVGQQTIALLDTGVDIGHPDLAGHLVEGYDFFNRSDMVCAEDRSLADVHGTHLAGIIAETAPEAKIMPLKVFQDGVAYTSDIIEAIHYAEKNGATIVNCSWGGRENNMALQETIARSSLLFVCAAGNNGNNVDEKPVYPGAFGLDNIVNVTSVNDTMALSYFSNYGTAGVDIAYRGRDIESTYPGGTRNKLNGTSVSAAFVSAAASLSSGETPAEKKQQLLETADKLSYLEDKVLSGNYLNLENLVSGMGGSHIEIAPEADPNADHSTIDMKDSWQLFANSNCKKVAVGYNYSLFLMSNGEVYVTGGNKQGFRKLCTGMKDVVYMYEDNFLLLTMSGNVTGAYGDSFGDGNTIIYTISSGDIVEIAASESGQELALTAGGNVWGWGENSSGEAGEGEPIIEDGRLIMFDYIRSPKLVETTSDTILSNITKIRASFGSSYAFDANGDGYQWGWRYMGYTDYADCYAKYFLHEVRDMASYADSLILLNNDYTSQILYRHRTLLSSEFLDGLNIINGNFIVKHDGSLWMWNIRTESSEPEVECVPFKDLTSVVDVFGKEDGGFAIKEDGSVWCWGDNSSGRLGVEGDTILTPVEVGIVTEVNKEVISNEEYAVEGNPAYQAGAGQLEQLGWKADNALNGNFTAESGKLVIQKNSPVESGSNDIVYSVSKQFTKRTDEWNGDPRVSVWTNHFKGDYGIELQGSFHQNSSWMYYDILGATNTGTPASVARYKIGPTTKGGFSVYNNRLNGADTRDYTLWENPTANNSILTKLMSSQAVFQTYLNGGITPVKTTVAGASPDDTFNMTDWNKREPAEYITGLKFSVQGKELAGSTVASLDHVKLIEYAPYYDVVDFAIDYLSMSDLTQTPEAVTENLNTLAYDFGGAIVTWTSSRPDIIRNDGALVGFTDRDTDVIMTAKITNPADNYTKYKEFRLTVPGRDGFLETYPDSITGTPSSADKEGTKTFEQLPMWNFSYPGISNGANGEVHSGQVLVKDGYLTFKKISDRQTDNYNECVVGTRSLSNFSSAPRIKSANIAFTASAVGTGTLRFAPLNADGKTVCTIVLDASVKTVVVVYGEEKDGSVSQIKQHLSNIDPRVEHLYELQMRDDNTFVLKIDGAVIQTESNEQYRRYLPWAGENCTLSQMKVWITNITRQNTEIGKLKNFSVTGARLTGMLKNTIQLSAHEGEIQTFAMGGTNQTKSYEIKFDPAFFDYVPGSSPDGVIVEGVTAGSARITYTAQPAESFQGILCKLMFKAKQNGNSVIEIYESEVE